MRKIFYVIVTVCMVLCFTLAVAACNEPTVPDSAGEQGGIALFLGSGSPNESFGKSGDICLVIDSGALYNKTEGGWIESEYESYKITENGLNITYGDGSTATYFAGEAQTDCTHETLGELITIYEPLCVIPGIGVRVCSGCNEAFAEIIPATGEHRYEEGGNTCIDCGKTDYFKDVKVAESGKHAGKYVIEQESFIDTSFAETDGEVYIPGEIDGKEVVIDAMAFGSENYGANTTIKSVVIGEGVKEIGQRAFQRCTGLESVTLPESLTVLGAGPDGSYRSDYLKIFEGCTSLREVKFGSKLTVIGNQAFTGCTNLTSVEFPASLTAIHYGAFQDTGLQDVVVPANVKELQRLVFSGCNSLRSCKIECDAIKGQNGSEDIIGISSSLFKGCVSLASIELPANIEVIASSAFEGCSALEGIEIPAKVTTIATKAFQNCNNIAYITFAKGSELKTIESNAFYCGGNNKPSNEKLQSVILPEGFQTLGKTVFGYCTVLESVVIPSTITSLGTAKYDDYSGSFPHTALKHVYFGGSESDWQNVPDHEKWGLDSLLVYYSAENAEGCWHWQDNAPVMW